MEERLAPQPIRRFSKGTILLVSLVALLVLAAAITLVLVLTLGDGDDGGNGGQGAAQAGGEANDTGSNGGASAEGGGAAQGAESSNPLSDTTPPPLPDGGPATHYGKARMTTVVSGQTFTVDVGITIRLDEASGFLFAYAGTGTVPVNLGPGVAATADYVINGNFQGAVEGEAFTGTGPVTIQAAVNIPGMAPQPGGSTQQLTIRGTLRETEEGRLEGDFVGGSFSGSFWAESV